MSSPEILQNSPSGKGQDDMAEDIENATTGNARVEVTEPEVRTLPRNQARRAFDGMF